MTRLLLFVAVAGFALCLGACTAAQFDAVAGGISDGLTSPPPEAWPALGLGPDPTLPDAPPPLLLHDNPTPYVGPVACCSGSPLSSQARELRDRAAGHYP